MDTENNFDSDTSESWSFIDINTERSSEIKIADEMSGGLGDTKFQGEVLPGKSSALPGERAGNGAPAKNTRADVNVASSYDHLKTKQDFQVLYKSKIFEEDCDGGKTDLNCSESNMEGEKIDSGAKDLDEDTDGISVISESEYNDIKVANYESDEVWDEKASDSDATEKPHSNVLRRKRKTLKLNYRESSEESVNSDMVADENYSSKSINLKRSDSGSQRKQHRLAPLYKTSRGNFVNSVFTIFLGILFTAMTCIMVGHFIAVHESQEPPNDMAQTLKKLQMENLLLHSRLSQLSRAIFNRGGSKPDIKEDTFDDSDGGDPTSDTKKKIPGDCTRPNTDPDDVPKIDLSLFLKDPHHFLNYEDVRIGNENIFGKGAAGPFKFFNISKYVEDYMQAEKAMKDHFGSDSNRLKAFEARKAEYKRTLKGKKSKAKDETKKVNKKDGKRKNIDCKMTGSKLQDADGTQKENCLAIREKDLSEFRWFLLKAKPKSPETETEGSKIDSEPESLNKFEYRRESFKENDEEFDDLSTVDTVVEERDDVKDKDDDLPANAVGLTFLAESLDDIDDDDFDDEKPETARKGDVNSRLGKRLLFDSEISLRAMRKNVRRIPMSATEYADKYLKYFEVVENDVRKNNWKMKDCIKKDDGKCEMRPKKKKEGNVRSGENPKKNIPNAGSKGDGKVKDKKKDQFQKVSKAKKNPRVKKLNLCSIKPTLKHGNESGCEDYDFKSGDWFSRWAEGRERCRRDQRISEWQFERAKSRAHSRIGDAFWQFSRAYGRQNRRMNPYMRKKKVKYFAR